MGDTLDLNRRWTLAEAAAELWARGVSVKSHADGYHLNYAKGGTPQTEFVADDLIEALNVGYEMAEHKPAVHRPTRRRRPPSRKAQIKARIRSHNRALARRQLKKKSKPM